MTRDTDRQIRTWTLVHSGAVSLAQAHDLTDDQQREALALLGVADPGVVLGGDGDGVVMSSVPIGDDEDIENYIAELAAKIEVAALCAADLAFSDPPVDIPAGDAGVRAVEATLAEAFALPPMPGAPLLITGGTFGDPAPTKVYRSFAEMEADGFTLTAPPDRLKESPAAAAGPADRLKESLGPCACTPRVTCTACRAQQGSGR